MLTEPAVECPGCRAPLEQLLDDCFLCRDCSLIRFGDAAKMANIAASITEDREILECFNEDRHRGARNGSGGSKGRRKPPPARHGPRYFDGEGMGGGPFGPPDSGPPSDYGRGSSSVVALRLSIDQRERLHRLAERHGNPANAVRAGLAALEALDACREAQADP